MGDAGVGWITAIIVGGIAGWLAEQFMKSCPSSNALRQFATLLSGGSSSSVRLS